MHPATEHVPSAQRLFAHLPRADQRRWAGVYVKGLLCTPGKKTLRRIAASVTPSPTAPQSLQQFVNDSAWPWRPVRAELTRWVAEHAPAHAWTLCPVVIPKRGALAVGVHRRFVPASGRTVNCQLAVGAFLSGELGDLSVDWRLYLPRRWSEDAALRHQARIPDGAGHASAAELCLALADRLVRTSPVTAPVVVHTDGHIDAEPVIEGLQARGLDWVVVVPDTLPLSLAPLPGPHPASSVRRADGGTRRGAGRRLVARHTALETVADRLRRHARPDPAGPPAPGRQRLGTTGVLLPGGEPAVLAGVWSSARPRPDRIWLTNLPPAHQPRVLELLGSAPAARIGDTEAELGLHDFAGRSYPGWHRHATLVSVAAAHRRLGHEMCLAPGDC
ncbi:IS701 family transposase [Streptomyces longwoodensis]|uniref:IS701 family transposase n=1 Tax=Streptomyces longwoodensis TaxID=68231 RepID=UPI00384B4BB0